MNLKSIFILVASGLYFFTCHYWYCCKVKGACYGCAPAKTSLMATAPAADVKTTPVSFDWSTATPILNTGFVDQKANWLEGKSGDNLMEITGLYYEKEEAPEGYKDMGFARADELKKLLMLDFPDERIRLKSKRITKNDDTVKSEPFEGVEVKWISGKMSDSEIIDFGKKAIIRFPTNSYKKETNKAIDSYLKSIAQKVLKTEEIIFLTGHTDDAGTFKNNLRLGLKRAMRIRRILRQQGVPRHQIVVNSKGETEPVASNDTEAGRYQNRRVILELKPRTQ